MSLSMRGQAYPVCKSVFRIVISSVTHYHPSLVMKKQSCSREKQAKLPVPSEALGVRSEKLILEDEEFDSPLPQM